MGQDVGAVLDAVIVIATDVAPLEGELAFGAIMLAELYFGVFSPSGERCAPSGCVGSGLPIEAAYVQRTTPGDAVARPTSRQPSNKRWSYVTNAVSSCLICAAAAR
jgi:hypothetical protein